MDHPVLGKANFGRKIYIILNGKKIPAYENDTIASALYAAGIRKLRFTPRYNQPRGIFCAIGRCTDCVMTVNGVPNVRTCITYVKPGIKIQIQKGLGRWKKP